MPKVRILISVSDCADFKVVLDELMGNGLKVRRVQHILRIIEGSIESSNLETLKKVNGIMALEEQRDFQLPPPDSALQ